MGSSVQPFSLNLGFNNIYGFNWKAFVKVEKRMDRILGIPNIFGLRIVVLTSK